MRQTGQTQLYVYLTSIFVTCLILGDIVGGKTVATFFGPISVGMIAFPVTFLLTDVVNDFYGALGARRLTLVGFTMASFTWVLLQVASALPTDKSSYFSNDEFLRIFGGSAQLFLASMVAYLIGQFLDIYTFQFWKRMTQSKHLWLRATGSTLLSQAVDTIIINFVFWLWVFRTDVGHPFFHESFKMQYTWILNKIFREYAIKVAAAVLLTPMVYVLHSLIVRVFKLSPEPVKRIAS